MSDSQPQDPAIEALIDAEVARASAPYEGLFPPEVLEDMKRTLRIGLETHPASQYLLQRLKPDTRGVVDQSGKQRKDGEPDTDGAVAPKAGGSK